MSDERYEDNESMNEDFAAMLEESMSGAKRLEPGQKIEAKILQIGAEWVFLDVGQKGEGVLDVKELQDEEGALTVEVGDAISAYFLSSAGGELRFTTRLGGGDSGTAQLEEAWRSEIPVDGRIDKEIKGGFDVRLPGNVRSFCPYSQVALRRVENAEELVGQSFSFKITQFESQGRNIVVSRRALLEEEQRQQRESLKETLSEGMRVTGTITSLRDFGAFVDIGGLEGLLPISEVAYGRVEDISEVLSVGQTLELVVKSIDWEKNRFAFSRRDTLADPWSVVPQKYKAGTQVNGTVSRLAPFGAFVTLEEGIDGLVHISKLGEGRRITHPREVVQVGQQLAVTVEKLEPEARRISLVPSGSVEEVGESSWSDKPASGGGMGTFADLLKAAEAKKKKK
ncbi:MAG: 30S ribosomal protein S1 [Desulfuromonas sp.]|nr:MAG: 30S ribosomal protein S1 [Desulfuromonas sp.]